jgi:hypothetical protein
MPLCRAMQFFMPAGMLANGAGEAGLRGIARIQG